MTGGRPIPFSAFSPAAVPSGVKGVVKASLGPLGFNSSVLGRMTTNGGTVAQLFLDGNPMMMARTPNVADDGTWWATI